jgi:hypothetical protein
MTGVNYVWRNQRAKVLLQAICDSRKHIHGPHRSCLAHKADYNIEYILL